MSNRIADQVEPTKKRLVVCNQEGGCLFEVCGGKKPHEKHSNCGHCEYTADAECCEVQEP